MQHNMLPHDLWFGHEHNELIISRRVAINRKQAAFRLPFLSDNGRWVSSLRASAEARWRCTPHMNSVGSVGVLEIEVICSIALNI